MDKKLMMDRSIHIITEYYKNNLGPFFDGMDEDVLWIGPVMGQWLRGKEAMLKAWEAEKHDLTFSMRNISATHIPLGSAACAVVLRYEVYTHYPSGVTHLHNQRLHYTWREKREGGGEKRQLISVMHISNAEQMDERDAIYPVHYENVAAHKYAEYSSGKLARMRVQATDGSLHILLSTSILYIESSSARQCKVHTRDGEVLTTATLSDFEAAYAESFIRAHSGYLVNPMYVREVRRFQCLMEGGAVIPIPEKKYTRFKKALSAWADKWN
ncbi:MAG: LytTR family DNA-binding domain-containing protein [Bacillota bacterium]|nr:LytTR family DNA-binding domain-containing protein [Bacillota bacterium]